MRKQQTGFLLILIITIIFLAACGPTESPAMKEKERPVIKLLQRNWLGFELNNMVAKILLEEELGYKVEIGTVIGEEQFERLANGDLHAHLEIWSSLWAKETERYLNVEKSVEHGGELGVLGKVGWFIPSYMLIEHPELEDWEALSKPEIVELFRTPETGEKGMLVGAPLNWGTRDAEIIQELALPYEIITPESEDDLIARIESAYQAKEPILFYFWTPHYLFSKLELVQVKLPPPNEACYAKIVPEEVVCYYPTEVLFKAFWSGLKDEAPSAYQFLKNFNYTNEDQISMMGMVEIEGRTVEEAARSWIENNRLTWELWMP